MKVEALLKEKAGLFYEHISKTSDVFITKTKLGRKVYCCLLFVRRHDITAALKTHCHLGLEPTGRVSFFTRENLSAYFQKIFGAEKELIWFLGHNLAQKGYIKQRAI